MYFIQFILKYIERTCLKITASFVKKFYFIKKKAGGTEKEKPR